MVQVAVSVNTFLTDYNDPAGYCLTVERVLELLVSRVGSKRQVHGRFKISRGAQEAIERGQTASPSDITLQRLSEATQALARSGQPLVDPEDPQKREIIFDNPRQLKNLWELSKKDGASQNEDEINPASAKVSPEELQGRICKMSQQLQERIQDIGGDEPVFMFVMAFPATKAQAVFAEVTLAVQDILKDYDPCLSPGASTSEPDKPSDKPSDKPGTPPSGQAESLEFTFKNNCAAMLATLVNIYQRDHGLTSLEEVGRVMARLVNPEPSRELTLHFTALLESLQNDMRIPEDRAECLEFLMLLARILPSLEGGSFNGDVEALLEYIGC